MTIELVNKIKDIESINVVETKNNIKPRHVIRILKIGNWYNKLIEQSLNKVKKDIGENNVKTIYFYNNHKNVIRDNVIYISIRLYYCVN